MQLKPTLAAALARLTAANVPSPRLNAELLLMFILNCDRAYLYSHPERELTDDESARYEACLTERSRGVPAQYLTGHQEFWGMDFLVTPAVLIPRPETEHLIEAALNLQSSELGFRPSAPGFGTQAATESQKPEAGSRIADVGTGSGCIALALAKELPQAEIHATDISEPALEIARANAARLQLDSRVRFHHTDLLAGFEQNSFDLIVSNPPYVGESEEAQVQQEVRKFEPRHAVFAGPTGTEVIARLIPQAHAALKPGGSLILEISGSIVDEVIALLEEWKEVKVIKDLQQIPRVIQSQK